MSPCPDDLTPEDEARLLSVPLDEPTQAEFDALCEAAEKGDWGACASLLHRKWDEMAKRAAEKQVKT
jgi:hypothetical protein